MFSPKLCSDGIWFGGSSSPGLCQRRDAPYPINPKTTFSGFGRWDFGINISMIELTFCGRGNGTVEVRDAAYMRFDEWESLMGGGRLALRIPIIKNLIVSKIGTKCVWNHESCTHEDANLKVFFKEGYNKWGLEPEVKISFNIPKSSWNIDFLYEYQNLGRITLKEEISGNINYENLVISKYSIGCYVPFEFPNPKLPTGKEKIPFGLVFSLINKSDGRVDWSVGLGFKGD
ncbi:MAG: hypothetical protein PHE49_11640 [bacterium]|nr:hypothetical protein [bacterium]